MKTLTTLALAWMACGISFGQNWERDTNLQNKWIPQVSIGYNTAIPNGGMNSSLNPVPGGSFSILLEQASHRLAAGIDVVAGSYTPTNTVQEYEFPDGTSVPMEIRVANNITTVMGVARLYIVANGPVRPFATVRGGYSFLRTRLAIIDPDDMDSCEPVESTLLNRDGTFAYSAGGGVRIDAAWLFQRMNRGRVYFDLSATMLQGGRVQFMTNNPPPARSTGHSSSMRTQDVQADFINTVTQVVHPHHVGYLNSAFLQMTDLRFSVIASIGR